MTSRYIDPYTDFGFKKLFGEEAHKDLLIDFLNAVLPEDRQIETLTFQNPENRPDSPLQRLALFDIFCRSKTGEQFIVEMQKVEQEFFRDRSVFYSTFPIRKQAVKGAWDFNLKQVYFVAILNFRYDEKEDRQKFLREVTLKDQDGDLFYDKLYFLFFQMPLFTKTESELQTRKDKWFYFLKNLVDFDTIPAILQEPVFERAFEIAEYVKLPLEEQERYEHDLKIYRDNYATLKTAENKGIEIGKTEGRAERQVEIARNFKRLGVDPETIAQATGLSIDEIKKL
ncbi:MAG: Rpn family recombination-promoting nuclease/putative transposase [Planctomycetaceae bacterium]|jgi:predicted transposase/invertase (TIGR01784 family)|nr:Rpn family recombination-promoting nuclease/putative transposase [Planctomycetaceae bacterium]